MAGRQERTRPERTRRRVQSRNRCGALRGDVQPIEPELWEVPNRLTKKKFAEMLQDKKSPVCLWKHRLVRLKLHTEHQRSALNGMIFLKSSTYA